MSGAGDSLQILNKDHLSAWRHLMGEAFPASGEMGAHYLEDFPVWDLAQSVTQRQILGCLDSAGMLLGGAGARLVEMRIPGREHLISGAVIGAVATATHARKRGIATRCLEGLLQWCDAQGAEFVALWGSDHAFYGKFGFTLQGLQTRIPVRELISEPSTRTFRIQRGWNAAIGEALIRSRNKSGLQLRSEDQNWVAAHPHVDWWSAWEGTQLRAYAGVGKGMDLHHFVHEWGGGDPAGLSAVFAAIAAQDPEAQVLGHPRDLPPHGLHEGLALLRFRSNAARALVDQFWFWGLDSA